MAWSTPRTWVTGEVVTAAMMNANVRDNTREIWRLIGQSSDATASRSIGTSAVQLASAGALTFDGSLCRVDISVARVEPDASGGTNHTLTVSLFEATTELAVIGSVRIDGTSVYGSPVSGFTFLTPSAGSHTYLVKAYGSTGTGTAYGAANIAIYSRGV